MFGKKKILNLKSSFSLLEEKNPLYLNCKFKYGFSIALCKKKNVFDFKKKRYSETLNITSQ